MRQSFALRHATLIFQTFPGLEHVRCDALAIRRNSRRLRPARRDAGQYSRPVWAAEVAEGPRLVRREQEQGKGPGPWMKDSETSDAECGRECAACEREATCHAGRARL